MRFRLLAVLALALVASACGGNVFDLEVGQCFQNPDDFAEVSNVNTVDCDEPHHNEVYHLFDLVDGDYPGAAEAESAAIDGCIAAFDSYVGAALADSQLDVRYLYPSEETWGDGDREVVCSLYDLQGDQLTGSMRGSGI